jgi:hypothetical protein
MREDKFRSFSADRVLLLAALTFMDGHVTGRSSAAIGRKRLFHFRVNSKPIGLPLHEREQTT